MRSRFRSAWSAMAMVLALAAAVVAQAPLAPPAAVPAPASAQLTGIVTDSGGYPESGAVVHVQLAGRPGASWQRVTSDHGIFTLEALRPGVYFVDVLKGSRVAPRQRVVVHADERAVLLVSLPEVASAVQFGRVANPAEAQQLRWALRQPPTWRPVFRLLGQDQDQDPAQPAADAGALPLLDGDGATAGYISMTAGGDARAFSGNGSFATAFQFDTGLWGDNRMALTGNLSTSGAYPDSSLQAAFHPDPDCNSQSVLLVSVRSLPMPGLANLGGVDIVTLNYADGFDLGDRLHLQYGAMFDTVTSNSTLRDFGPYLRAAWRVDAHGSLEYRFADARPPLDFGSDLVSMLNPAPVLSLDHDQVAMETAQHQEVQFSQDLTANDSVTAAVFADDFAHTGVNGAYADAAEMTGGNVLPDLLSNMFVADGGHYSGNGYRVVYQRRLSASLVAAAEYSDGVVLEPGAPRVLSSWADALRPQRTAAWTAKLDGTVPRLHTQVVCSYRALDRLAVTALDPYDDGPAASDSYANLLVRQPLPNLVGSGNRIAALVEVNNLLAQGYVPIVGSDGHTMDLVQSARTVRGGFSINF